MLIKNLKSRFDESYGWVIVLASFILMTVGVAIIINCTSLFIKPISDDLGFSRQQTSAIITIKNLCTMVVSIFFGKIINTYDLKKIMRISIVVLCVSFFSYSFVNTLSSLYIITLIVAVSYSLIGLLPISLIINNWFYTNSATAMGLAFTGSGIGGMIFNSLAGQLIMSYGWRVTHQILAVIMFVILVPTVYLLIYIHPKDKKTIPYGYVENSLKDDAPIEDGISMDTAIKTIPFWILFAVIIFHSMSIHTMLLNTAPHLSDEGYSIGFSANIVALTMGALAISKIILGRLYDSLGVKKGTIISSIATFIGLLGLIYSANYTGLFFLVTGTGLGGAFITIAIPLLTKGLYGQMDYAGLYGLLYAAKCIGAVLSPLLSGYTYDVLGSYTPFLQLNLFVTFFVILAYQYLLKNSSPERVLVSKY